MDFFEEFEQFVKLSMFLAFHWFRIFLAWCHKTFIKPIESTKEEPPENKWVQIYTLASCDIEGRHKSFEKYFLPYTDHFFHFVENEFNLFLENGPQEEIIENLFIVKYDNQYIVKSFPMYKKIEPITWTQPPRPSEITFNFVEYYHPKMLKTLELIIPTHFYTIGNDLFTNAFVLRQLELMNCFFIFDDHYEIRFLDHEINDRILKFDEYIVLHEKTYDTIKSVPGEKSS
jgi:hypothetical protein